MFMPPYLDIFLGGDIGSNPASGEYPFICNIGTSGRDGIAGIVGTNPPFDIYLPTSAIRIGDSGVVIADGVRLVLHEAKPVAPITTVEMHTMAPPGALCQFTIVHEALGNFGNAHTALGIATMNAPGDHLTIANVGSSGNAGAC